MNTVIPRIDLSRLSNAEFINMMSNIKALIEKFDAENLGVKVFKEQFDGLLVQAKSAMASEHSSGFTLAMESADFRRDDDYRVFYFYIKAFTFSGDVATKEAATQVMRIIRDGDNPLTATRDEETTLLETLFAKLTPEPYASFLDELKARTLLNTSIASNKTYKDLYAGRSEEQSAKSPGNVAMVRLLIAPVYKAMVSSIVTYSMQYPNAAAYKDCIAQVAEEVKHNKTLIAQHAAKDKKSEK